MKPLFRILSALVVAVLYLGPNCSEQFPGRQGEFIRHEASVLPNRDSVLAASAFLGCVADIALIPSPINRQTAVDSLLAEITPSGFPYIESPNLVHFICLDTSETPVRIEADFNNWVQTIDTFKHVPETNLHYFSGVFPADARIEYKLIIHGIRQRDPLNQQTCCWGDFSLNSEVPMPEYHDPPEILEYAIPHGTIESFTFHEELIPGRKRTISVYLPPGYNSQQAYPVAYFHDGSTFLGNCAAANILDYLLANGEITPLIAVFVDPASRDLEYFYDEDFRTMFVSEIVPYVDAHYHTLRKAKDRAIIGFSLGGLTSLFFVLEFPEMFGNCAAFSPALHSGTIIDLYQTSPAFDCRFYIDAGTYEYWILEWSLKLVEILEAHGFAGHFYQWHEYHSIGSWRAHLDLALKYFFPKKE